IEQRLSMADTPAKTTGDEADPTFGVEPEGKFAVAIFLSDEGKGDREFVAGLARVGSLPILLRNILAARKLGPSQIIVEVDPLLRTRIQLELGSTGRLPKSIQWIEANADVSPAQRLQRIAAQSRSDRLILIDGTTTYHPSLLQKTTDWNDER